MSEYKLLTIFILLALLAGAVSGSVTTFLTIGTGTEITAQDELILDFYMAENAVHVSPHHIRKAMDKGDDSFILVDLRSQEEYEREHIIGAINIPAYKDPETSAYGDVERIVNSFSELSTDKDIIVYCYSIPCMTGRKVGKMLAENSIYVKHLGVGWNEWRYFWTMWNHEHEWNETSVEDYVISGPEPGTPEIKVNSTACPIEGEFGC
jgi:rhodanese-related sulfurtransferase